LFVYCTVSFTNHLAVQTAHDLHFAVACYFLLSLILCICAICCSLFVFVYCTVSFTGQLAVESAR
jgi:hypothetical protein